MQEKIKQALHKELLDLDGTSTQNCDIMQDFSEVPRRVFAAHQSPLVLTRTHCVFRVQAGRKCQQYTRLMSVLFVHSLSLETW